MKILINIVIVMIIMFSILIENQALAEDACPDGYQVVENTQSILKCTASADPARYCNGMTFVYLCGEGGKKCCSLREDNPCMNGFYSCGSAGLWGPAKVFCCKR